MTMKATQICIALAGALAVATCGIGASAYPNFTHTPAFHLEGVRTPVTGGPAQRVSMYRDGAKFRVETQVSAGRTIVVFDRANDAFALTALPTAQPNDPASQTQTIAATTTTLPLAPPPNTAGVAMHISDAMAPQPLETPWSALQSSGATNLGHCTVAGQRGSEWRASATALAVEQRTACITPDGIVLRERESGKTIFEATLLQRGPQPAALFGVPAGYQRWENAGETASTTTTALAANTGPAG